MYQISVIQLMNICNRRRKLVGNLNSRNCLGNIFEKFLKLSNKNNQISLITYIYTRFKYQYIETFIYTLRNNWSVNLPLPLMFCCIAYSRTSWPVLTNQLVCTACSSHQGVGNQTGNRVNMWGHRICLIYRSSRLSDISDISFIVCNTR